MRDTRRHRVLAAAALAVITLASYSNSFQAGFALDNKSLLLEDPRIQQATSSNVGLIFRHTYWWPTGESGLYRPLTTLSYLFNFAVLREDGRPAGYHAINLALHLGNVMLVYALALALMGTWWPAFFTAAIWAVHPVLTESVTNIVGRADLLAAMAVLAALLIYRKGSGPLAVAGLAVVTTAGVFSKESAAVLPLVIVLYELVWPSKPRPIAKWLAIAVPVAVMLGVRAAVLAGSRPAEFPFWDNPLTGAGFWTARLTAIKILALYLWRFVWPLHLSCDYSYAQIPLARGSFADWVSLAVVGAALTAMALLYRRHRTAFFFAAFALVTLLPTANIFFLLGSIMAERFLYLPSVGLAACLAMACYAKVPRQAPLLLCTIIAAFAARTWARNPDWHSDLTMAEASIVTSPDSFKTHYLLSTSLFQSDPEHRQLNRVLGEAEKSLAILDNIPDARNNAVPYRWAGECYLLKGDLTHSPAAYSRAVEVLGKSLAMPLESAGRWAGYHALAAADLRLSNVPAALDAARHALELEPRNPASYRQEAEVLVAANRSDEAAVRLMQGVFLTADPGLWQDLLELYHSGLDAQGCATRQGPRGVALNPECAIVRRDFCQGLPEAVQFAVQTSRPDLARNLQSTGSTQFGCK